MIMEKKPKKDLAIVMRLRAAGCPMPTSNYCDTLPGFRIASREQDATKASVLRGWVEYVFDVTITNVSYADLQIQTFKAFVWETRLEWARPVDLDGTPFYRMPGSGREFPFDTVLNHRQGRLGVIHGGETLAGTLLAYRECAGVPDEGLAGPVIPADLCIVDNTGQEHFSEIEVGVDRTVLIDALRLRVRPELGLFANLDPRDARWRSMTDDAEA
jgi:hypothetical protein